MNTLAEFLQEPAHLAVLAAAIMSLGALLFSMRELLRTRERLYHARLELALVKDGAVSRIISTKDFVLELITITEPSVKALVEQQPEILSLHLVRKDGDPNEFDAVFMGIWDNRTDSVKLDLRKKKELRPLVEQLMFGKRLRKKPLKQAV